MAQQHSRCNLSAARHPLVTAFGGRTIILPQHDMNFQKSAVFAGADVDKDVGVPQVFYMHNAMPTEQGYQSVGYSLAINPLGGASDFDQAITLLDTAGNKFLFVPAGGKNYIFDAPVFSWVSTSPQPTIGEDTLVTTAFVQGVTYIFYEGIGLFVYNNITKTLTPTTLIGLVTSNIVGIVGASGYLLCWDINGILYWSSTINPLDFVPSLVTGSSSGAITDLKGKIVVILPSTNGFIVYATGNAVGGSFSGNIRFPFTLKEITGSGGIRNKEHVSFESNLDKHYALTSSGLQTLTKTASEVVLTEISDFITNRIFEDYDDATKIFTLTNLATDLLIKLTVIGSRYFVISYGQQTFTHALVYDIVQKKWGKLKITHVDCFQYNTPNLYGEITYQMLLDANMLYSDLTDTPYEQLNTTLTTAERPRRTIGFLQADGTVKLLRFDGGQLDNTGVFLLGKYQFTRGHGLQILGFEVENVDQGSNYAAFVLPSFDGKNFQAAVTPTLKANTGFLRRYQLRKTGLNHTLLFTGSFNLTTVLLHYAQAGMFRV
jgi:hypothetical protein